MIYTDEERFPQIPQITQINLLEKEINLRKVASIG